MLKYYAKFSGLAIQMGVIIFIGAYAGKWLDVKYPADKKWFTILFTLVSVAVSLVYVLKQVNKLNNEMDKKDKKEKQDKLDEKNDTLK